MSNEKQMNAIPERLFNGLIKENPTFVLMLGMCPTLAVTTSAMNGLGMGLTTTVVLMLSNMIISMLRNIIPKRVRIPAFIVIIASFVTMVQLLLEAYLSSLNEALGMYIPLIVVNCIILGRAESYAYSNPPIPSLFDGLGMGLGFSMALTCIGGVRELLGAGSIFDYRIMPANYVPINIFVLAPGAFFVLAALTAFQNFLKASKAKVSEEEAAKIGSGCSEDCMNCGEKGCSRRFYDTESKPVTTSVEPAKNHAEEKTKPVKTMSEKAEPEVEKGEKKAIKEVVIEDLDEIQPAEDKKEAAEKNENAAEDNSTEKKEDAE